MNVDLAYERYLDLLDELPPEDDHPFSDNEACTRLRLIDPLLREVLGWPVGSTWVEIYAGADRLDYALYDAEGVCWIVVEAKKRTVDLVDRAINTCAREKLKLSGPVLKRTVWPIVDNQMSAYLGRYNPEIGIVTNGDQWVGFLSRALPPGVDRAGSHAVVFRSPDAIKAAFERFHAYFSRDGLHARNIHRYLTPDAQRGAVTFTRLHRVVESGDIKPLAYQNRESFYHALAAAMDAAFKSLNDDPEALEKCFVETRESEDADQRLQRIAQELQVVLRLAERDYPDAVDGHLERNIEVDGHLPPQTELKGAGYLARLIGEPSAGKTTFLRRFYNLRLADVREKTLLIWLDCHRISPLDENSLSQEALGQVKDALFGDGGPDWKQFREVYHAEWRKRLRVLGVENEERETDRGDRRAFVDEHTRYEHDAPARALSRYLTFAVRNRRLLPIIVLDNADNPELAVVAARWAMASHLSNYALTTVALEDTTLWRLRRGHEDQLGRHAVDQFWLPRPKVREVLESRLTYLRSILTEGPTRRRPRIATQVGRNEIMRWEADPDIVVRVVSAVLLEHQEVSGWIGKLCNYDMSEIFAVCREVVVSPHVQAEDLLKAQTGVRLSRYKVLKALIAPRAHQFEPTQNLRVSNVFGLVREEQWAPLLPARLLAWLRRYEDQERSGRAEFPGFAEVARLCEVFDAHVNTPPALTRHALDQLSQLHLIESFDPTENQLRDESRVKIAPRGRLHLDWALSETTYLRLMAEVDPLVDISVREQLREVWASFVNAVRSGDSPGCNLAEHELIALYVGQLLGHARRVAPVSNHVSVHALVEFEMDLEHRWASSE